MTYLFCIKKLEKAREAKGLDKIQASTMAGFSLSFVARLERGEFKNPKFDSIKRLANLYSVDLQSLMAGSLDRSDCDPTATTREKELVQAFRLASNENPMLRIKSENSNG